MNVLFIGDIVGKAGRLCVKEQLPKLKEQYHPDLIIANGENAAHGKGITKRIYTELLDQGIDMITMGNHTFSKNDIYTFIHEADRMVRPANMEPLHYGVSTRVLEVKGMRVAISNLCGETFMNNVVESPFTCMERILENVKADLHFVDLHGETTSEKMAFTYHFAGRVHAVVGTHTHVQTADERSSSDQRSWNVRCLYQRFGAGCQGSYHSFYRSCQDSLYGSGRSGDLLRVICSL